MVHLGLKIPLLYRQGSPTKSGADKVVSLLLSGLTKVGMSLLCVQSLKVTERSAGKFMDTLGIRGLHFDYSKISELVS